MTNVYGKVAKLLNEEELAINRGSENGITMGMTIWVIDDSISNIIDPDTQENLGGVARFKVRLKITGVGLKAAVAERYVTSAFASTGLSLSSPSRTKNVGKENPDSWPERVRVGDRFVTQDIKET